VCGNGVKSVDKTNRLFAVTGGRRLARSIAVIGHLHCCRCKLLFHYSVCRYDRSPPKGFTSTKSCLSESFVFSVESEHHSLSPEFWSVVSISPDGSILSAYFIRRCPLFRCYRGFDFGTRTHSILPAERPRLRVREACVAGYALFRTLRFRAEMSEASADSKPILTGPTQARIWADCTTTRFAYVPVPGHHESPSPFSPGAVRVSDSSIACFSSALSPNRGLSLCASATFRVIC